MKSNAVAPYPHDVHSLWRLCVLCLRVLRLLPERFHLLERGVFQRPALSLKTRLDRLEAADEFRIGGAQRFFRVQLQMARQVGHREQEIAEFLRDLGSFS